MTKWLYLFLGGGAGTIVRYICSGLVCQCLGIRFPFGTLAVNLLGCFLAGFFAAIAAGKFVSSPDLCILVIIGFLGGFTTFSTFMLETASLIKEGQVLIAFINVMASVCVGFIVFRLGILLAEVI